MAPCPTFWAPKTLIPCTTWGLRRALDKIPGQLPERHPCSSWRYIRQWSHFSSEHHCVWLCWLELQSSFCSHHEGEANTWRRAEKREEKADLESCHVPLAYLLLGSVLMWENNFPLLKPLWVGVACDLQVKSFKIYHPNALGYTSNQFLLCEIPPPIEPFLSYFWETIFWSFVCLLVCLFWLWGLNSGLPAC